MTLLILLALTLLVAIRLDHLGWIPYSLARDLPWAGLVLAGLSLSAAVGRRLAARPILRLEEALVGAVARRAGVVLLLASLVSGGLLAAALPSLTAPVQSGLTLRIGTAWRQPDPTVPPKRVSRLSLGPHSGPDWRRGTAFTATLTGWIYAPLTGGYDFAVGADHGVVLEVDGRHVVRFGYTPAGEPQGSTSDPEERLHRGQVWLEAGVHRLEVASAHQTDTPRLTIRWIPPHSQSLRRVPPEYLMPDGTSESARSHRLLQLGARRVGVLIVLVSVTFVPFVLLGAARPHGLPPRRLIPPVTEAAVLLIVFARLTEPAGSLSPGQLTLLRWGLVGALILGVALVPLVPWQARVSRRLVAVNPAIRTSAALGALLVVQGAVTWRFIEAVAGRLITSVDHGAFIYRYHALAHTFPRLVNYDPWLNAGTVDETIALSGAALVYLLTWPLTHALPLESAYQWLIPVIAIGVIPWALFAATRTFGLSPLAALVAGILALAPGESFALYLFNSGTLPALASAAMVPLAFALAWRVFVEKDRRWWVVGAFAVSVNLGLLWPLFPLMLLPGMLLGALLVRERLHRADVRLALALAVLILGVNAAWLIPLAGGDSVAPLVEVDATGTGAFWITTWNALSSHYPLDLNPITRVAGTAGLILLPQLLRAPATALAVTLLVAALMGSQLLPYLELDRLVIPLGLVLIPPAAALVGRQLRASGPSRRRAVALTLTLAVCVLLAVHLEEIWERYGNMDSSHRRRFRFMSGEVTELVGWLRLNSTVDARTLLTPNVEERLPGGSAFLSALTNRPLVARMPYLSRLGYGDFVTGLMTDPTRLLADLELLNVRHIVAAPEDAGWLTGPELAGRLRLRASWPGLAVYETGFAPSYLQDAAGSARFDYNRIEVRLDRPRDEVVLRFRWRPGLFAQPPLPVEAVDIGAAGPMIRVRPGNVRAFEVRY